MKFLAALLDLIERFFKWKHDVKLREEGRTEVRKEQTHEAAAALATADTVRRDVAADLAVRPDSLRDDDGFKRAD